MSARPSPALAAPAENARLDPVSLALTVVLAVTQDAAFALIYLSYMNHYLLDVLHTSAALPGYTLALYGGVKLVIHPVAGRVLDRTSPRRVFFASIALQATGAVVMFAIGSLGAFLAGSCLLAAGSAGIWPLAYETVGRTQPSSGHSLVAGVLSVAGYLATGAGLAAGLLLAQLVDSREVVYGVLLVIVVSPAVFSFTEALAKRAHVHEASATPAGQRLLGAALLGLIVLIDYAAFTALAGTYGPYVRRTLDITLLRAGVYLLPAGFVALVALLLAARWSRPGRRLLEMGPLFVLSGVGALGLAAASTPWLAATFAIPLAAGAGGVTPIIAAAMIEQGDAANRGVVVGALMSIEGLGGVIGPAAAALVITVASPSAAMGAIGLTFVVLAPMTIAAARGETAR